MWIILFFFFLHYSCNSIAAIGVFTLDYITSLSTRALARARILEDISFSYCLISLTNKNYLYEITHFAPYLFSKKICIIDNVVFIQLR